MKIFVLLFLTASAISASAQKPDSICFHLYTDSLKKGVYNYINVDGKLSNGRYIPLDTADIKFTASYGKWFGNSLVIDSSYTKDSVVVQATSRHNPAQSISVTMFIKKRPDDEVLKTLDEILNSPAPRKRKRN
ncbi:hypothetical protein [Foetidibacter luteolus]|uniref:hypothetical protein n=1 Tax=Foetidibacter luteolus TaxID=2608880 RepID=UPI00129BB80D|nr:hypothetical protein [Foetidibacter luteolus]